MELVEKLMNQELDFIKRNCHIVAKKSKIDEDTLLGITLEKCWEHRATFKSNEDSGFRKWMNTCIRNHAINIYRTEYVTRKQNSHRPLEYYNGASNDSDEDVQYEELGRRCKDIENRDLLCQLLLKVRKAFPNYLHYKVIFYMNYQGYKYREMADACKIPIGTVRSTIHRLNQFIESERNICN